MGAQNKLILEPFLEKPAMHSKSGTDCLTDKPMLTSCYVSGWQWQAVPPAAVSGFLQTL